MPYSYDRTASKIKEITKAYIRTYTDSGQETAYVEWVDDKGKKGRTEGSPDSTHMKALLDRAKREKVKVEKQKWSSVAIQDPAFERMMGSIEENAHAIRQQVSRLGGIASAMEQGHAETIRGQLNEIGSSLRTLQRRLGF